MFYINCEVKYKISLRKENHLIAGKLDVKLLHVKMIIMILLAHYNLTQNYKKMFNEMAF